jgi:hypothetical protein
MFFCQPIENGIEVLHVLNGSKDIESVLKISLTHFKSSLINPNALVIGITN